MPKNADWLPTTRTGQLSMAWVWHSLITQHATEWKIEATIATTLKGYIDECTEVLAQSQSAERTKVITTRCNEAFKVMIAYMRDIKKRYFYVPPLKSEDLTALGLNLPDTTPTPIGPPTSQVSADVSFPGKGQHLLNIKPVAGHIYDNRADYGFKIHWGIMPHGGATTEQATSDSHYLMKVPETPEALASGDQFTKRKKELITHTYNDSGMTAYYCIRYENNKGDKGPWGPMINAVIP